MYFNDNRPQIQNVFLYIRQSTDEDAKKQVRSLYDQQVVCEELAAKIGLNIVETFREDQSAKSPHKRPIFKTMLKELSYKNPDRRRADGIIAWHPDRLSRNALEAGMIIQMLDDEQIKDMFFPAYSFHNDPSGKEHLFIEFARAKGYSDHLSVSVSRGSQGREREGAMIHSPKFGYIKKREIPEKPALCSLFPIPCPQTFPIVRRMFDLRAARHSLSSIEIMLRQEGLQPVSGKLGKSRIARILADPFYFGQWTIKLGTRDERVIDFATLHAPDGTPFTPVLTEQAFLACQQANLTRPVSHNRKHKHINPFPIPIVCNRCRRNMRPCWKLVKRAGGKLERQLGYECQTTNNTGQRCGQPRIKAEALYLHIAEAMQNVTVHKRHYHRFLAGAEQFIKQRIEGLKQQRNLYTLDHCSMVITDTSGELFAQSSGWLKSQGYAIRVLNLMDINRSHGFNPLAAASSFTEISQLAHLLISSSAATGSKDDPFWTAGSEKLIRILLQCLKNRGSSEQCTLARLKELLSQFDHFNAKSGQSKLDQWILESTLEDKTTWQEYRSLLNSPEKVVQSFLSTADVALMAIGNPDLARLTAQSEFDFQELRQRKTALYVLARQQDMSSFSFILNTFYTQLFNALMHELKPGELPVYALLDE